MLMIVGAIAIALVLIAAYGAALQCQNNALIAQRDEIQGEIQQLHVEIKSKSNVATIEDYASEKLGMRFPASSQIVYLSKEDTPAANFAAVIRDNAYN